MTTKKPDAYELFFKNSPSDIIKCEVCGFKAVKYQFDENKECPACKTKFSIITKGKIIKGGDYNA